MFARAMGLATRASLIQYYWVECRCSAPAFSPSTEERAPSTRWKEAFSLNDAFSEPDAPRVALGVEEPLGTLTQRRLAAKAARERPCGARGGCHVSGSAEAQREVDLRPRKK